MDHSTGFEWKIGQSSNFVSSFMPSVDHTTGAANGHVIYLDYNPPAKFNDTARLISPVITAMDDEFCFRFHYYMFGSDVGRLSIYVQSNVQQLLWTRERNQVSRIHLSHPMIGG